MINNTLNVTFAPQHQSRDYKKAVRAIRKKQPARAAYYYKAALKKERAVRGEQTADAAKLLLSLGDAQLDSEQYDDAIKSFDKARGIFEAIGAEAEKELGYAYTRLGVAYAKIANHAKAQEYFLTALPIYEKTYGTEDRKTAVVYNNIGTTHLWQENYTEAMPFLLKAYKFYLDKLGKEDAKTQETMRNIRRCYHYMGKNPAEFGFWLDCKLNPPQL